MTSERCAEFDCCECGRHIVVVIGVLPDPRLCGSCLFVPGWYRVPELRAIIDPNVEEAEL